MGNYFLSQSALADLDDIWNYIADNSLQQADKTQDRIFAACQKIANHIHIGRPRPELRSGLRSFQEKPYLIFYTIENEATDLITIRRIIHHSRDLTTLF